MKKEIIKKLFSYFFGGALTVIPMILKNIFLMK